MIKLIASDLDGTLLRGRSQRLDPEIFSIIHRLKERGITFAAASGRQYPNLRRLFIPVWQEMLFVAENGNLIMHHGQALDKQVVEREMGLAIAADIERMGCPVILSGEQTLYLKGDDRAFVEKVVVEIRNTISVVDDFAEVDEPFLKLSAYCWDGVEAFAEPLQSRWGNKLHADVSGRCWIDFTAANKGDAIDFLQKRFGYKPEEIIAFGDNFNDVQMLEKAGRGYLMETADPRLREKFPLSCSRVEDTLNQLLNDGTL